jgi:hypothetical protein
MNLGATDRMLLADVADLLIPAGNGMPSASQAGVADEGLAAVVKSRPELEAAITAVLQSGRGQTAQEFLTRLTTSDAAGFGVLAEVVAGAYFMNQKVRAALGYSGQIPQPISEGEELDPALLKAVLDRGPIYRPSK